MCFFVPNKFSGIAGFEISYENFQAVNIHPILTSFFLLISIAGKVLFHITKASDKDKGVNAALRYKIISGNEDLNFALNLSTGSFATTRQLDYETGNLYILIVSVADMNGKTGALEDLAAVKINIQVCGKSYTTHILSDLQSKIFIFICLVSGIGYYVEIESKSEISQTNMTF